MSWVLGALRTILSAVKPLLLYLAAFHMGKKSERTEREKDQAKADYKALVNTINARDAVSDDPASVYKDPRNRDQS